jgi:ribosomal protein L29
MHIKDLRSLSTDSLNEKLDTLRLDLSIEMRKIASTGVANKKAKVREIKRTVAQILTLINERGAKQ